MVRAGTRDRGPEPRAPFQSEAGGRVCPFLAVGGGGRPQGSGPRGCRDAGASHTRRQAAECGRRSPGLPHTLERPGSARRLPARAAPAWAATAPAHSALETPRPAASPGWQVSHTPCPSPPGASCHTGSQTGAQAGTSEPRPSFKTPTRRMKCPQLGAARGDARQPPPTPHFTQTSSCSLSQHPTPTRVWWRQPPRSLHGAEQEEGPGARGLVERPSLGRGVRCARPCQLAGCTLSEYQHQEGHGTGPTFSAAPPETGHADVHTGQQQPPPMTQATVRTVSRELACVWAKSISGMRTWALAPGQQEAASPGVRGSLGLCPALACPPAGEAGPMSRQRPRDSRPCSRGPQRPRPPPRPRPGGSDVRCSRADLPPAV